jgi:hypothetical protein
LHYILYHRTVEFLRFKNSIIGLAAIGILVYVIIEALKPNDFTVYLEAAKFLAAGKSPYEEWFFVSEGNFCLYFYSPFWALLLIPLTILPPFLVYLIWGVLNVLLVYRIGKLLLFYIREFDLSAQKRLLLICLTLLLSIRFLLDNFGMLQMTVFILWGMLESLRLLREGKLAMAGVLLAFIVNIKLLGLVLVPYLIYRGHFKILGFFLLGTALFLFLPALYLGWSVNLMILNDWWGTINPSNAGHLVEMELGPHSLTALIPSLFMETNGVMDGARNIASLNSETVYLILNGLRVALIVLTLYVVKWPPFKAVKGTIDNLYEVSYLLLLIPLIFPHQQKYAFLLCVVAQFYLLFFLIQNYSKGNLSFRWKIVCVFLGISFVLMTLTSDGVIGKTLNEWTQHYKFITYGAIILIPALFIASPKYIQTKL